VPHRRAAARADAAGAAGGDDLAGVCAAVGDGRPQSGVERVIEAVGILRPQGVLGDHAAGDLDLGKFWACASDRCR